MKPSTSPGSRPRSPASLEQSGPSSCAPATWATATPAQQAAQPVRRDRFSTPTAQISSRHGRRAHKPCRIHAGGMGDGEGRHLKTFWLKHPPAHLPEPKRPPNGPASSWIHQFREPKHGRKIKSFARSEVPPWNLDGCCVEATGSGYRPAYKEYQPSSVGSQITNCTSQSTGKKCCQGLAQRARDAR